MKKTVLLLIILCVGALNGMETKRSVWDYLPQDIQSTIVKKALETSNDLKGAIAAIKNLSVMHGAEFDKLFSNLKDFTALVHMLADKFDEETDFVAEQFKTPIAKEYIKLADKLIEACRSNDIVKANTLIAQGADANHTSFLWGYDGVPLSWAVRHGNAELVKLLLDNGAKPIEGLMKEQSYDKWLEGKPQEKEIKQMLERARQK